jgi:hypothetical protein
MEPLCEHFPPPLAALVANLASLKHCHQHECDCIKCTNCGKSTPLSDNPPAGIITFCSLSPRPREINASVKNWWCSRGCLRLHAARDHVKWFHSIDRSTRRHWTLGGDMQGAIRMIILDNFGDIQDAEVLDVELYGGKTPLGKYLIQCANMSHPPWRHAVASPGNFAYLQGLGLTDTYEQPSESEWFTNLTRI